MDTPASLLERLRQRPTWMRGRGSSSCTRRCCTAGALRRLREEDAADLVQDVFVQQARENPRVHLRTAQATFRGWLRTVTLKRRRENLGAGGELEIIGVDRRTRRPVTRP